MRALSASTSVTDPFRAGVLLGEALAPLSPELVLLFSSIHYGPQGGELLEGLHDGLERDEVVLVGSTGDGFYESGRVSNSGAAALGLDSGRAARWRVARADGAHADPAGCARRALKRLDEISEGETPRFILLLSDFRVDGRLVEAVLHREAAVPVIGGLAADDYRFERCFQFVGRQLLEDHLVLLGAYGELAFDISVGFSLRPVGEAGTITGAAGSRIERIDGDTAMEFVRRQTGKPALLTDRGVIAFSISEPGEPGSRRLRSVLSEADVETGALGLFGSLEAGTTVQACLATPEDLVEGVYAQARRARERMSPKAALVMSCAGRKGLLGGRVDEEIRALSETFPGGLPFVGIPSFGEFGPLPDESGRLQNYFHNMTYVLLLIGDGG